MMDLSGQVALITGGAGHIGAVVCKGLAELGASIVVVDRESQACQETVRLLGEGNHSGQAMDLVDRAALEGLAQWVEETYGRLDVLVHCAAFVGTSKLDGWAVPFGEQSDEAWCKAIDLNLTVPFLMTQRLAGLLEATAGRVVNVSSIYGFLAPDYSLYEGTSMQNPAAYGASKGGLLQLTKYLATTLAPHVRVNAVSPGGIERGQPESFRLRYEAKTPLGRMGREEDIVGAVAFLATSLSDYVTGQNIAVDGGWSAW